MPVLALWQFHHKDSTVERRFRYIVTFKR